MRPTVSTRIFIALALLVIGCQSTPRSVVIWISIDGLRHDYVDREPTPTFHKLIREGASSHDLVTIVPSLTFPSHVSEATGVDVKEHGIPTNDFYDVTMKKSYSFPDEAAMLQAEPIWLTAKRQGVRTLVYDWPLSHAQQGKVRDDYFRPKFDSSLTDQQRLDQLLETWQIDRGREPLRLIMGYIKRTDVVGHEKGPDSPEVTAAVHEIDAQLQRFIDRATQIFHQKMRPGDELYVVLTTDHGMTRVRMLSNLEKLFDPPLPRKITTAHSGPVGMIYLDKLAAAERAEWLPRIMNDLKRWEFLKAYRRGDLPKEWRFDHPTRVGDIVVFLKPGYDFSTRLPLASFPVERVGKPLGAHGYIVADCPDMRGLCVIWRYPMPLGGKDLGEVRVEQLHPTVAKLLGVSPAAGARAKPLSLPR